jgi:hypothetical protein
MDNAVDTRMQARTVTDYSVLPRLTWSARLAVVWAAAGGTAGGALIAALLLAGRSNPEGATLLAPLLAAVGSALGVVHGAMLGHLGRHAGEEFSIRRRDRAWAVAAALGALLAAQVLSLWLVMSVVLARSGSTWGWVALLIGVSAALAVAGLATSLGWRSLERAWAEWPQHGLGIRLLAGSFTVICLAFVGLQPAVPGTQLQLPLVGWLVVALFATLWLAGPAVVLALRARDGSGSKGG